MSLTAFQVQKGFPHAQAQSKSLQNKTGPRGGWEDDFEGIQLRPVENNISSCPKGPQKPESNIKLQSPTTLTASEALNTKEQLDVTVVACDEESFLKKYGYENSMIENLIQPGGARLKQQDSALEEFSKACESLDMPVIASLLISKLNSRIVWISKARALFAMQVLIKNINAYFQYFKRNIQFLRRISFENEGVNRSQLNKIFDSILNTLGESMIPLKIEQNENLNKSAETVAVEKTSINAPKTVSVSKKIPMQARNQPNDTNAKANFTVNARSTNAVSKVKLDPFAIRPTNTKSDQTVTNVNSPPLNSQDTSTQNSVYSANISAEQSNSIANSLLDIDFTNGAGSSPNNFHQMYQNTSSMMYHNMNPSDFPVSYNNGYNTAHCANYPMNNYQDFTGYYQQQMYSPVNNMYPNYQVQSGHNFGQNIYVQQTDSSQIQQTNQKWDVDWVIPEEECHFEEIQRKQREENELRFEALNF